jgi:hypothetical protein
VDWATRWGFRNIDALVGWFLQIGTAAAIVLAYFLARKRLKARSISPAPLLAAATLCSAIAALFVLLAPVAFGVHEVARRTELILYHPDHPGLLRACREIIRNHESYRRGDSGGNTIDKTDPALPAIVRDLDPAYITADNTSVHVVMACGLSNVHLLALRDDTLKPDSLVTYELCPGLWIYEWESPARAVRYPPGYPNREGKD